MIEPIDPRSLYPDQPFFLDYVGGKPAAVDRFQHRPMRFREAAAARRGFAPPRRAVADRLRDYNERLGAPDAVLRNIDALARDDTLCIVGGQQVGFLGGPLYTAYKIHAVLHAAEAVGERLNARIVPVFWWASEDHDFTEINRVRFVDDAGDLRTITFDWPDRGRPIERLPVTEAVQDAANEALEALAPQLGDARELFRPEAADDYATWHARIWRRLVGDAGLVQVEPRTLRPLAGPLFAELLGGADRISAALAASASHLSAAGYPVPIDPTSAGRMFAFDDEGRRGRVEEPARHVSAAARCPQRYSPDAALRPLVADALLPTLANVLGPSELAYHALLDPVYRLFAVPQPLAFPRGGYTLLDPVQADMLSRFGLTAAEALSATFDPAAAARAATSPALLGQFAGRKRAVRAALEPLVEPLEQLDPGLPARWRQTADRIEEQLDGLEGRAVRVDLARRGLSLRELRRLRAELRPADKPQERVVSLVQAVARFGPRWIDRLEPVAEPGEYAHYAVSLGGAP